MMKGNLLVKEIGQEVKVSLDSSLGDQETPESTSASR